MMSSGDCNRPSRTMRERSLHDFFQLGAATCATKLISHTHTHMMSMLLFDERVDTVIHSRTRDDEFKAAAAAAGIN